MGLQSCPRMFTSRGLDEESDHKEAVYDVAYEMYGRRMATCAKDFTIKVWDLDKEEQWRCTSSWRAHNGVVLKVAWAHPEYGSLIASCSNDRTAIVWEETQGAEISPGKHQSLWVNRWAVKDPMFSITDVRFSPRQFNLHIATCSKAGLLKIYQAPNVLKLEEWVIKDEYNCKRSCSCLAWSNSKYHPPTIAVGSDSDVENVGGQVIIFEFSELHGHWELVQILASFKGLVRDITFANHLGRSYHQLAVASSQDVSIVALENYDRSEQLDSKIKPPKFVVRRLGKFTDHQAVVYRVSWNITGTILASSGDDGTVRLWKENYPDSNWKCIAIMRGDQVDVLKQVDDTRTETTSISEEIC